MGTLVTMTSTVGQLTSGQAYYVRSREAEALVANSKATKSPLRSTSAALTPAKVGKRSS